MKLSFHYVKCYPNQTILIIIVSFLFFLPRMSLMNSSWNMINMFYSYISWIFQSIAPINVHKKYFYFILTLNFTCAEKRMAMNHACNVYWYMYQIKIIMVFQSLSLIHFAKKNYSHHYEILFQILQINPNKNQ